MTLKPTIFKLFDQLCFVLQNITNDQYITRMTVLSDASIGQHMRHLLEFLKCFDLGRDTGKINYDLRERNIFLESNTLEAISVIEKLRVRFDTIDNNQVVLLELSYGDQDGPTTQLNSNVFRELVYNIEHAIHHMALIKIALKEIAPNLALPDGFGVASSTIRYKNLMAQVNGKDAS